MSARSGTSASTRLAGAALAALALSAARSARADDPPPAPPPPSEVQVIAPHRDVGEVTVRREDTKAVPGTFGDPTRIAEVLPGVVPTASGLQAYFVRGAPPTSTGTFVDGVPVPVLYHVGFGPSVIHPGLLDHVDFYQGAPPAQYGRYVGAVLSATTLAPAERPRAEANLRLFDAGALGETTFGDGRGSALAAARYGYPGLILPLFTSDTALSYWDYQARATWNVDERDRIGAFVFGSYDRLTQQVTPPGGGSSYTQQELLDQFHRVDLRWDRALGPKAALRVGATLGQDTVGNNAATAVDQVVRLRAELDTRPSRDVRVRAGADAQLDLLRQGDAPEGAVPARAPLVPSQDSVVWGAHADASWRISPQVEITPGLRGEIYDVRPTAGSPGAPGANATPTLEPRLAVRAKLLPGLTSVSAFGLSHQLLGIPAQYPSTSPYIQPGLQEGMMSSVQGSQGVEVALPGKFSLGATAFLHAYSGLPDATWQCPTGTDCVTPTVDGRAYGLELLLRRSLAERWNLWISYTLSRSTRQARTFDATATSAPTMTILSEYDRTHVLSVVTSYDFGHDWRAGARVFAYSGRPYTPVAGSTWTTPYDSARLPGFFRLDARLEKSWKVGQDDRVAVVLEGINLTLNKETVDANCGGPASAVAGFSRVTASPPVNSCTFDTLGPITIPSIGVEGTFR